jgi:hypothetical protein
MGVFDGQVSSRAGVVGGYDVGRYLDVGSFSVADGTKAFR